MDKLQWFKFTPTDWVMGKIQRCPEITQARFMRLICLYWNKECVLSYEDAEIEIDKEHLDILINKKIIKTLDSFLVIGFLNEQFKEIECSKEDKSNSAKIGNLKRWHKDIYERFMKNEITLQQALLIAYQSHPDSDTIAPQSQNIAEKRREEEEKKRKELEKTKNELLESVINKQDISPFTDESLKPYWHEWKMFRLEKQNPLTPSSERKALEVLFEESEGKVDLAIKAINKAIASGHISLNPKPEPTFKPKEEPITNYRRARKEYKAE